MSHSKHGILFKWTVFASLVIACETSNKYKHEVGYIDPEKALGSPDFQICSNFIYQYYNSASEAGYKFGKKALRDSVNKKYKRIFADSGYLTIRFIINCKGIAGRYEFVEADLELRPKKFNTQLKDQFFKIITELKEWKPLILDSISKDSYMYITFKLKNGYVDEILP